jgi:YaiO family outer membrane protein
MLSSWMLLMLLGRYADAQVVPPAPRVPRATVEAGGAFHALSKDQPRWSVVQVSVAGEPPMRVRPVAAFERQVRADRPQARGELGAYVDWSPRVYTLQTFSIAQRVVPEARYYPRLRGDVRAFVKLPDAEHIVIAAGFTALTFAPGDTAQLYNAGFVAYGQKTIAQATVYVNRSQRGPTTSAAANVAVQRGAERVGWYGVTVGAGRELYRIGDVVAGLNADFTSVTISAFARRWLSRAAGVHVAVEQQRVLDSYSRLGLQGRLFVQF